MRGLALAAVAWLALPAAAAADLWDRLGEPAAPTAPAATPRGAGARDPLLPPPPKPGRPRLGATAPLSGPRAPHAAVVRVAKAMLEARGVAEVVIEDDGALPYRTLPAARHLEEAWRVAAFLSPLEPAPLAGLVPYLRRTATPTLFLPASVSDWAGPRIIALPPSGAALTRALAAEAARRAEERRRRGSALGAGALVVAAATEDGDDRLRGALAAGLPGAVVVRADPETATLQPPAGPPPGIVLALGPPRLAAAAARLARRWPGCAGGDGLAACAPPVLALSVTEPFRWEDLADPDLVGALTADWLPVERAALDGHAQALRAVGWTEPPSRLTLWGHALAELTEAVVRRAGPAADGAALLRAAEALGRWSGAVLREVTLGPGERRAVRRVRLVTLGPDGPEGEPVWLTLDR